MVERVGPSGKERLAKGEKVLVLGASGLVGRRFMEILGGANVIAPNSSELDKRDLSQLRRFISERHPKIVIDFSAYTDVTKAESQKPFKEDGECFQVNVQGTRNVLDAIDPGTHYIYFSTDMALVGCGVPGPYAEHNLPILNFDNMPFYGYTKAYGEILTLDRLGDDATIVRISYPVSVNPKNKMDFFGKCYHGYKMGGFTRLFDNQNITVTYVDDIVRSLKVITERSLRGIYHVSSTDVTTPYKIYFEFLGKALRKHPIVRAVGVPLEPEKIKRYPPNGGLDVKLTQKLLNLRFKSTSQIVDKVIRSGVYS